MKRWFRGKAYRLTGYGIFISPFGFLVELYNVAGVFGVWFVVKFFGTARQTGNIK
ncbi:MAG: hypothetical protein LBJ00_17270 [Planctomycetaceae bacterium]|jgi:hypothetical protein|nr:hypothetical protein [Planctomycetaceae bacterium]